MDTVGFFRRNSNSFEIKSGFTIFTKPGDHYSIHPNKVKNSSIYYHIAIDISGSNRDSTGLIQSKEMNRPFQIDNSNRFVFDQIFGKFNSTDVDQKLSAYYLLLSVLYNIKSKKIANFYNPEYRDIIEKAITYMSDHINGSLKLSDLSNHLNLSEQYFIKLFKMLTGLPPMKYYSKLRVEESIKLIMKSNKTLSSIAEELDFSSLAYFSKLFKQYTSMTPVQYRNNYINSLENLNRRSFKEIETAYNLIQKIIDATPDLIFFKDINDIYMGCNKAFCEFVGLDKDSIIGHTDKELFKQEISDFFIGKDQVVYKTNQALKNQELLTYPNSEKKTVEVYKAPFHDSEGRIMGLIGISRQIL